jgi:hypothetical protein
VVKQQSVTLKAREEGNDLAGGMGLIVQMPKLGEMTGDEEALQLS